MNKSKQNLTKKELNKELTEIPRLSDLHPEEMELLFAFRVMNEIGKQSILKVAMGFAKTPTMRNKWIRGI